MPAVNGMYSLTVEQLDEVKEYVDPNDLLRLFKRLLRNAPAIEQMLDQLESLSDLMGTVGPIGNGAYDKAVTTLQSLEQRGYFTFARGGAQIADNIVTSFGEEDVKKLGEKCLILNTVKEMTQPEIMGLCAILCAMSSWKWKTGQHLVRCTAWSDATLIPARGWR